LSTDGIAAALIGAAGTIAGALIAAYREWFIDVFRGRPHKGLIGDWQCKWDVKIPAPEESIHDIVTIDKITAENVRGTGRTPDVGSYRLTGRLTDTNLMTLYYEGIESRRSLGGVAILHLDGDGNTMNGYWYEFRPDRKFIGGSTEWTKDK